MRHISTEILLVTNHTCSECGCGECTPTDTGRVFKPNKIGIHQFVERPIPTTISQCSWNLAAIEMLTGAEDTDDKFTALKMQQLLEHIQFLSLFGLAPLTNYLKECFEQEFGLNEEEPSTATTSRHTESPIPLSATDPTSIFLTAANSETKEILQPLDLWLKDLSKAFPFIRDVIHTDKLGEENTARATLNQATRGFNFAGNEILFVLIRDPNDAPKPEDLKRGTFLLDLTGDIEPSYLNAQFVLQLLLIRKCNIHGKWDKVLNTLSLPDETIQDFYYNIEDLQQLANYLTNGQFRATDFEYVQAVA